MLNLNEEDRCISAFHFIFISFIFFPSFVLRHDWPIHFRFSNEKWPTWVIYSLSHSDNWTEKTLSRQDTREKSNELLTIPNKLLYLQHSVSCSHMSDNSETQNGREKRHTQRHNSTTNKCTHRQRVKESPWNVSRLTWNNAATSINL